MKSFSKSFFALFLAIMLFLTWSTRASAASASVFSGVTPLTVTLTTECDATKTPCNFTETCASPFDSTKGITVNGVSVPCSSNNEVLNTKCAAECDQAKIALSLAADAAYKAKLDPMGDATYNVQDQTFSRAMCQALKVVTGSAGKTFAAFAIIATGIGFFTGKVSWGLMIGVTAGIATMFGAPSIVAAISGQDTEMKCNQITR
jgi:type IV secretory pathway VirB2 component (pilin)